MLTALITGASSGIGAAFARHLAARGHRLVLVARDGDRLAGQVDALRVAGAPQVEVLPADLTEPAQLDAVADRVVEPDRPVDLLVNNAGIGIGKDFAEAAPELIRRQIDLNVTAVALLTRAAVPAMTARGFGGIINVASVAGLVPGRGSSYPGTKAFVVSLSEGLAMSLHGTGVRIQALCPGFVRTEFHQRAGIRMGPEVRSFMYVDVDKLVETSLADLAANRPLSIPGGLYKTAMTAARLAPRGLVRAVASRVNASGRT